MNNLIFETVDQIGVVKVDRPSALNALNQEVVTELDELLETIRSDDKIAALIIGSGDHFAAGADIKGMADLNAEKAKELSYSSTFNKLANLEIPTIAAIEGFALGGGLELALACDFRIASKTAKMGFPEINLGIMPGAGGTVRGARLIGESRLRELIFFGDIIDADQAEKIGLVNKTTEPDALTNTALSWAVKLCGKPPIALKAAKAAIRAGLNEKEPEAVRTEFEYWAELFDTEDQKEGMRAFIEKRTPVYQGK